MLRYSSLQVKLEHKTNFVHCKNSGVLYDYIEGSRFPQQYTERTMTLDDMNCQYINQSANNENLSDCQVMGFIPDNETSNVSGFPSYNYECLMDSENQLNCGSNPHAFYTSKSTQRTLSINLKRNRNRTGLTTYQVVILEKLFQRKPYLNREETAVIMNRLHLSEKSIKVWFQNRRRMTGQTCEECLTNSPPSIDTLNSFTERLTLIEKAIEVNTDENGYVTLNDDVMSELMNIIDECLPKDLNLSDSGYLLDSTIIDNVVMYEPVSPVSSDQHMMF